MKVPVYSLKGEVKGSRDFSRAFSEPIRTDLISRAVIAEQSGSRQPYGADPLAGKRTSAHYHGRRKVRHSMMNREMARMARIHGTGFMHMTARFVPQATKGRKAHPPKVEKVWKREMNKKERMKALVSAVSATASRDYVSSRGHRIEGIKHIPLVVENGIESMDRIKEISGTLEALGLEREMERTKEKKVRSGRGTARGRRYKRKRGLVIVVSELNGIERAARNIPGVDVVAVKDLRVEHLAPGGIPGRLTLWSEGAIERFEKTLVGQKQQNEGGNAAFKPKLAVSQESSE
ncbi:MAG TPA: 50S ribosomal protein L4 [archaeon]|nr:50S ribosomal protein L4 [archaeon]